MDPAIKVREVGITGGASGFLRLHCHLSDVVDDSDPIVHGSIAEIRADHLGCVGADEGRGGSLGRRDLVLGDRVDEEELGLVPGVGIEGEGALGEGEAGGGELDSDGAGRLGVEDHLLHGAGPSDLEMAQGELNAAVAVRSDEAGALAVAGVGEGVRRGADSPILAGVWVAGIVPVHPDNPDAVQDGRLGGFQSNPDIAVLLGLIVLAHGSDEQGAEGGRGSEVGGDVVIKVLGLLVIEDSVQEIGDGGEGDHLVTQHQGLSSHVQEVGLLPRGSRKFDLVGGLGVGDLKVEKRPSIISKAGDAEEVEEEAGLDDVKRHVQVGGTVAVIVLAGDG